MSYDQELINLQSRFENQTASLASVADELQLARAEIRGIRKGECCARCERWVRAIRSTGQCLKSAGDESQTYEWRWCSDFKVCETIHPSEVASSVEETLQR